MEIRKCFVRQLGSILVMIGGCGVVFVTLMSMNNEPPSQKKGLDGKRVEINVRPKKKPPVKRRVRKPPQRVERKVEPRAPLPKIGVGLSGLDLGIPALAGDGLRSIEKSLVGENENLNDVVMTEKTVDVPPKPIRKTPPGYPPRARARGETGHVTMKILIDPSGRVLAVKVIDASNGGVFNSAASTAVRRWQFQPAMYKGQAVKVWAQQTIHFRLS